MTKCSSYTLVKTAMFFLLFSALLTLNVDVKAQGEPHFIGTWECVNCDADKWPHFVFNPDGTGHLDYKDGDYIDFKWLVNRNAQQQVVWEPGGAGTSMAGINFCQIIVSQTAPHLVNQWREFGNYGINFTCHYTDGDAVMIEPHNIWKLKASSGTSGSCTTVTNNNPNNNNGSNQSNNQNNNTNNTNASLNLDGTVTDLLNELTQAVASGNATAVQNITNQILEIAQQAYPDIIDQIQNEINHTVNTTPHNNGNNGNHTNSNTNKNTDYPEGWTYLKQYQKLLNDYVKECNHAVNAGDPSRLLNLATELGNWSDKNSNVFTHFTQAQSDALTKMTNYFADAMMKCATGAAQNLQDVHYADEAEQQQLPGNFVPNIQTGTINYTPDTKKPSGQYSGNGDLGNGNGMFQNRPESDPGPVDYKHLPK